MAVNVARFVTQNVAQNMEKSARRWWCDEKIYIFQLDKMGGNYIGGGEEGIRTLETR